MRSDWTSVVLTKVDRIYICIGTGTVLSHCVFQKRGSPDQLWCTLLETFSTTVVSLYHDDRLYGSLTYMCEQGSNIALQLMTFVVLYKTRSSRVAFNLNVVIHSLGKVDLIVIDHC